MVKKNDKKPNKKSKKENPLIKKRRKEGKPFHQGTANLIPIKKGEIRNPKGRPPNVSSIPFNIREVGKEAIAITITTLGAKGKKITKRIKTTKAKAIVYRLYARAIAGNEKAAKLLWEREMGKPMQTVAVGIVEGEDINVNFIGADFLVEDEEGVHGELTNAEDADFTETDGGDGQAK